MMATRRPNTELPCRGARVDRGLSHAAKTFVSSRTVPAFTRGLPAGRSPFAIGEIGDLERLVSVERLGAGHDRFDVVRCQNVALASSVTSGMGVG